MRKKNDPQLTDKVNELLAQGLSVAEIARKLKYKSDNTLYQEMYRRGLQMKNTRRFVPIHAPEITN